MNDDQLIAALRASRPTLDLDPARRRALHDRLAMATHHAADDDSPLAVLLLVPLSVAVLVAMMLLDQPRAPRSVEPSPLFDEPEWTIPVTSAEILPWMIQKDRPPLRSGQSVHIENWEDVIM